MISFPSGVRIYIACGLTDMRKGFPGLSMLVQDILKEDPFSGSVFVFRGRRGDTIKLLCWDGQGLCLYTKRLEQGTFIWPRAKDGKVCLSQAQLSMLLEGIDWRTPQRPTWQSRQPDLAG